MTGAETSPPTRLGRAPSIPATATITPRLVQKGETLQEPVHAGNAHVPQPLDAVAHHLRSDRGLLGHGQVGGACRNHKHAWARRLRWRRPLQL